MEEFKIVEGLKLSSENMDKFKEVIHEFTKRKVDLVVDLLERDIITEGYFISNRKIKYDTDKDLKSIVQFSLSSFGFIRIQHLGNDILIESGNVFLDKSLALIYSKDEKVDEVLDINNGKLIYK